jgi:hypothetical protein
LNGRAKPDIFSKPDILSGALLLATSLVVACSVGCTGDRPSDKILVPRGSAGPEAPFRSPGECAAGSGDDYPVGPGQKYPSISDVPWEALKAGDTVRIHYRPEPYKEKFMVGGVGTKDAPIRVCGVAGPNGERPIIDGDGAKTRPTIDFPYDGHQPRGLVLIGHRGSSPYLEHPEYIVIEGLEIRNAGPGHVFFDKQNVQTPWSDIAAGIFVQRGQHITIRGCIVHANGNGLFIGTSDAEELTRDVLVEGNYVYGNASPTDWYEHNVYNEASGVIYQFNRFGPPRTGADGFLGGNIKERSAGVVIRYNWIEDGAHLIDLVDAQEAPTNLADPAFHESWVYGNVLVRGGVASGSLVHYGGDSGVFENYRKGTLHFFHNTVLVLNASHREYETTSIFELSTNEEKLDMQNNVIVTEARSVPTRPTSILGVRDDVCAGTAALSSNWLSDGVQPFESFPGREMRLEASLSGFDASMRGGDPMFVDIARLDLHPSASAPFRAKGAVLQLPQAYVVDRQYVMHGQDEARPKEDHPTPGALAPR